MSMLFRHRHLFPLEFIIIPGVITVHNLLLFSSFISSRSLLISCNSGLLNPPPPPNFFHSGTKGFVTHTNQVEKCQTVVGRPANSRGSCSWKTLHLLQWAAPAALSWTQTKTCQIPGWGTNYRTFQKQARLTRRKKNDITKQNNIFILNKGKTLLKWRRNESLCAMYIDF